MRMNAKPKFITDNLRQTKVLDQHGGLVMTLPRYGVWGDLGRGKPEVIECGDDLGKLQEKFGPLDVFDFAAHKRGPE